MQTPRKGSDGEESGFSDANPFQSGNESARREEKQRRKVSAGTYHEYIARTECFCRIEGSWHFMETLYKLHYTEQG